MAKNGIIIPPEWDELAAGLKAGTGAVVYVLGGTDTGKSTLCRYLVEELSREAITGYLDCDTGQSTIGPPTTIGLALFSEGSREPFLTALRFVGSTSPSGHLIQEMTGAARLLQMARESDASVVVVDSPGWVDGLMAAEFHIRMIDLLAPGLVVAIHQEQELDLILASFSKHPQIRIQGYTPSPSVMTRSRGWRARYREEKFSEYFAKAISWEIALEGMGFHGKVPGTFREEDWRGLLIALCNPGMLVISLAIVETLDLARGIIRFRAPVDTLEGIASIQIGSVYLDPAVGF